MRALIAMVVLGLGCTSGERSLARLRHNQGLEALASGDAETAAERLLGARDSAAGDGELRFRAAYHLGIAHATLAEGQSEEPEKAIQSLRTASAWFADAVRLRPDSDDARANLEIVSRRAQALADQLARGENGLEARLGRAIADQRTLRDGTRQMLDAARAAGVDLDQLAEPAGELATQQRTLMARVNEVADLAGDELALIEQKTDEEMTQEEKVRAFQLQSLGTYLEAARQAQGDTRRHLRDALIERAHDRATDALASLVRAREQLVDPTQVLQGLAQDQLLVLTHTSTLEEAGKPSVSLDDGTDADADEPQAPAWLTPDHLAGRQRGLVDRADELRLRMLAAGDAPPPEDADPATVRMLQAAAEAGGHLETATAAMGSSATSIDAGLLEASAERQNEALLALSAAMELFAGLRQLIELSYRDQTLATTLLDPDAESPVELEAEERAEKVLDSLGKNRSRLARLAPLLAEEKQKSLAGLTQPAGQAGGGAADPDPQAQAAIEERFRLAEERRAAALAAVEEALGVVEGARRGGAGGRALELSRAAQIEIEELRRIFFSIVEHLEELRRHQSETRDRVAEGSSLLGEEQLAVVGPQADAQAQHRATAEALAQALAQQADAVAAQGGQAAEQAQRMSEAVTEVQNAALAMQSAEQPLRELLAAQGSVSLEPALEDQKTALEHLQRAIELLKPPQQQQQQEQEQQEQPQGGQKEEQEMSRDQAQQRLQAIRDREAQRRKDRRHQPRREEVEKDW